MADGVHTVNRWLSARFNLLSSAVIGITAFVAVLTPSIDASLAGFALAFATSLLSDVSSAVLTYGESLTGGLIQLLFLVSFIHTGGFRV